ncbi:protein containing planctomycete cytochrome C domain protein [Rhodopirellula baltica SH28]|uniref:Protein containing planctomycete cytochrome C domain protein n=1 Tax=Rhodopirellula baltica SH28 TaxID=993517 RepID=K5DEN9_RHOBT|nr:protein containing planctomycete cytochrome C domain protein [Rhodopirellula baltica SH28]
MHLLGRKFVVIDISLVTLSKQSPRSPLPHLAVAGLFFLSALGAPPSSAANEPDADNVSYHDDVLPILRTNCFGCHQGAKQLGEYVMTDFDALIRGGESGDAAIVPGDAESSYLISLITSHEGVAEMPKAPRKPLLETEVDTIRRWIEQGAKNDSPETSGPRFDADQPPVYAGPPTLPSIDLSPDEQTLAIAGYHEICLLDAKSGEMHTRLVGISPRINSVRFSPDGSRIAAAGGMPGELGELQIWNASTGELELSRQITYDTITGLSWSPDGSKIAIGANDNTVRALDSATGEQVLFQGAHEDWIRDTVFTPDGKHLVSVARDMTCKLTEVETERFIDNVTSITPGALSGGLSSVAMHPSRDEIVVGGSDGVTKVYRVFRQTKRQIGDDANLVRNLPRLNGRIRQVVVNSAGTHLAAVATIDGHSELRVWKYDFTGELTDELKAILGKRVANRSAEEKKKVDESVNQTTTQTVHFELPDAAAYSLELTDDGSVFVAANDGQIRHLDATGKLVRSFHAVPQDEAVSNEALAATAPTLDFADAKVEPANSASDAQPESAVAPSDVVQLSVVPESISLTSPYDYIQIVAIGKRHDGSTIDVTRQIKVSKSDSFVSLPGGLIRPQSNSVGEVTVSFGSHQHTLPIEITGQSKFDVDFIRDVNPVLSRLGCNQGTCHGAQKGKNGFRLSLRGYDPIFDIRALTDDLAARRINPSAPDDSMMLRKPLGITPHEGGTLMKKGDPYHAVLHRWIADGSKLDLETPRVTSLEISPRNPVVQSTDARQQVRIVATYANGEARDVTREAFISSGNTEVATAKTGGMLHAVRRGEAPVLARFEGAYAATTLTVMGDRTGYEQAEVDTWGRIDELVAQKWDRMKIVPSDVADDATFLRRVHLDLTGLPPTSQTVREFLADETPTKLKRQAVIDRLIGNEDFVEYWTNKWADLLQVNRKFLGVEGTKLYRDWIRKAVEENRPYDEFAYQILTASGSNQTNPAASYYKVLRTPEDTMENTTHLFLGIRFNCNKCHDHPFERWTQDQYYELAAYFAKVDRKKDPDSGNRKIGGTAVEGATPLFEIIADSADSEVQHARTGEDVVPSFPYELAGNGANEAEQQTRIAPLDGQTLVSKSNDTPTRREELASWMTNPTNPYFARSYVNRVWGYMTGVGLIEPIDDIRAGNPPTNPQLLDYLTDEFIGSNFDTRHLVRLIVSSRTYQLSVESNQWNEDDHLNYSHATPRRLPAEVIFDAVHSLTGATSQIPGMPAGTRAAAATDSGVALTDGFLANLGRPVRETACECERGTDLQLGPVMALISGPTIGTAISDPKNELEKIVAENSTDEAVTEEIFLRALGRYPTDKERAAFATIHSQIAGDHETLVQRLADAEAAWTERFPKLEASRKEMLSKLANDIEARRVEIADERAKMEADRQKKIAEATQKLADQEAKLPELVAAFLAEKKADTEWHPLTPISLSATNQATLAVQPDRSVLASGKQGNGSYIVDFETNLTGITGFRVEALTDPSLPQNGPGRSGNFVVTEITVRAGSDGAESDGTGSDTKIQSKDLPTVKIARASADFLQNGFKIENTFDGNAGNQSAWAVSGANGHEHWATFQFAKPIESKGKTRLRFELAQNHNAKDHQLGRFRISVTTDSGEIPLGLSETFAAAERTPADQRGEALSKTIDQYVSTINPDLKSARDALNQAKRPLPEDAQIVALQKRRNRFEAESPIDPSLVELRANVERSKTQLGSVRLTAAEDLVWALVNSPAFLFNH